MPAAPPMVDVTKWSLSDKKVSRAYLSLSEVIGDNADKTITKDTLEQMAEDNPFHPLKDYFDGLKDAPADTEKFEGLISWGFGESHDHADEIMRLFLVAAVARVYDPGVYYRYLPVLAGPMHIGKSFLIHLSPFEFGTTIEPQNGKYDVSQITYSGSRNHILEIGEFDAFVRSVDSSIAKNFISATRSETPIKYRNAERFTRTWVQYGSTNRPNFMVTDLADRVLPIDLFHLDEGQCFLKDGALEAARDGIWAAAVQEYFANWVGKPIEYDPQVKKDLIELSRESSSESNWWVECVEQLAADRIHFLTDEQIRRVIGNEVDSNRLKGFIENHGFVKKRYRRGGRDTPQETLYGHHHRIKRAGGAAAAHVLDKDIVRDLYGKIPGPIDHES